MNRESARKQGQLIIEVARCAKVWRAYELEDKHTCADASLDALRYAIEELEQHCSTTEEEPPRPILKLVK